MRLVHPRDSAKARPRSAKRRTAVPAAPEISRARRVLRILKHTGAAFLEDNVSRLVAAIAFYTTVAVAPLMVIAIAVAGFFFFEGAREKVWPVHLEREDVDARHRVYGR